MSAVTSRPRVRSVSSSGLAAVGGVAIAVMIGRLLRELAGSPQPSAASTSPVGTGRLRGRDSVARELAVLAAAGRNRGSVTTLDAARLEALRPLATLDLAVSPVDVEASIAAVMAARTTAGVTQATGALHTAVAESHDALFRAALQQACGSASRVAGFLNVHSVPAALGGFRMVATDSQGRALVTEFHQTSDESAPALQTEVVGVTDGSCRHILDTFDRGLDEAGVDSGVAGRRWTGGVCESGLARELVARRLTHPDPAATGTHVRATARRTSPRAKAHTR